MITEGVFRPPETLCLVSAYTDVVEISAEIMFKFSSITNDELETILYCDGVKLSSRI